MDAGRGADFLYLDWSRSRPFLKDCYQLVELLSCCHILQTGWQHGLFKMEQFFNAEKKKKVVFIMTKVLFHSEKEMLLYDAAAS